MSDGKARERGQRILNLCDQILQANGFLRHFDRDAARKCADWRADVAEIDGARTIRERVRSLEVELRALIGQGSERDHPYV
jgi:hypothetical protein